MLLTLIFIYYIVNEIQIAVEPYCTGDVGYCPYSLKNDYIIKFCIAEVDIT